MQMISKTTIPGFQDFLSTSNEMTKDKPSPNNLFHDSGFSFKKDVNRILPRLFNRSIGTAGSLSAYKPIVPKTINSLEEVGLDNFFQRIHGF